MATSFRHPQGGTQILYDTPPPPYEEPFRSILVFPYAKSEREKQINRLFERAEKDAQGRAVLKLREQRELEKIIESEKGSMKPVMTEQIAQKFTIPSEDAMKFELFEQVMKTGKSIYDVTQEHQELLTGTLKGIRSYLSPSPAPSLAPSTSKSGIPEQPRYPDPAPSPEQPSKSSQSEVAQILSYLIQKDERDSRERSDFAQRERLKFVDTDEIYRNSREQIIAKQALRILELGKGEIYEMARQKNREDEYHKRAIVAKRLKPIKTKGQRIIAPMNSVSFDMVVGYP